MLPSLIRRYGRLKLITATVDVALIALAAAACGARPWFPGHVTATVAMAVAAVPLFRLLDLYKPRLWLRPGQHVARLVIGQLIVALIGVAAFLLLSTWPSAEVVRLVGARVALVLALLLVTRVLATAGLLAASRVRPVLARRAIVIGAGEAASAFIRSLGPEGLPGISVEGILDDDQGKAGSTVEGLPVLGGTDELPRLAARGISDAFLAIDAISHERLLELIGLCQRCQVNARLFSRHFAAVGATNWDRQFAEHQVVSLYSRPLRTMQWRLKYALDRVAAAIALVVLSPVLLLVGWLVRLDSPGPALFVSDAIGRGEKPFPFFKYRSMRTDAPDATHRELIDAIVSNPDARLGKLGDDPRVTRLGRFLRRYSIDEVPQLINVMRGEMSLVGPRPSKAYELTNYQRWHRRRFDVLPGMTGLWQVSGRSVVSFNEMVAMDLYYIENFSLWLDLVILLRTVRVVLTGRGAS